MELNKHIEAFAAAVRDGDLDVYNEISLQIELGIFLRNRLRNCCKVEFERNVSYFGLNRTEFSKKEIDITIESFDSPHSRSAVELKYPRNGQFPESMFSFCKDIGFLEQLLRVGFHSAYFLAFVDHPRFYSGTGNGIYGYFRDGMPTPITGTITKPTGLRNQEVFISGSYDARWLPLSGERKFCLIRVNGG